MEWREKERPPSSKGNWKCTIQIHGKLKISEAKKKDLLDLCKSEIIPSDFHAYYKALPNTRNTKDCLAELNADEEGDSDFD